MKFNKGSFATDSEYRAYKEGYDEAVCLHNVVSPMMQSDTLGNLGENPMSETTYTYSPALQALVNIIDKIPSGSAQRVNLYEVIWPNQDKHLSAFVGPSETKGIYVFEIKIGRRVVLTGSGDKEFLVRFLVQLKTFDNRQPSGSEAEG